MLSVAIVEPGRLEIVDVPRPKPGPYEALVRSEIAFLCNATDHPADVPLEAAGGGRRHPNLRRRAGGPGRIPGEGVGRGDRRGRQREGR
jgi:hypothetical protein